MEDVKLDKKLKSMFRKHGGDKKTSQFIHAQKRARERYNLELTQNLHNHFVNLIQKNKSKLIEKQSIRVSKYLIIYNNINYIVAYDHKRKSLITFLLENGVVD